MNIATALANARNDVNGAAFALRVTLAYVLFGSAWVLLSDRLLLDTFDAETAARLQTIKGIVFIVISSALCFMLGLAWNKERVETASDRNQFARSLRDSEDRFRLALLGANAGVWDWNVVTGECYYSRLWKEMLGYTEAEIKPVYSEWERLVHPDDLPRAQAAISEMRDKRAPYALELRIRHKDGHYVEVLTRGFAVFDDGGRLIRVVGTHVDVTARKRAQANDARLAALVGASADAIISFSDDARIASWNKAAERLFGYTEQEAIGAPAGLLVTPGSPEGPTGAYANAIQGQAVIVDTQRIRKDGTPLDVRLSATPIRNPDGRITGVLATMHDITDRKQYERRLRLADEVFKRTRDGIVVTDQDGYIIAANPAFTVITGYEAAEAEGQHIRLVKSGHQDRRFYERMWTDIKGKGYWKGEVSNRRKDGEIISNLLTISRISGGDGKPFTYVGTFTDISDLKKSEAQLQHLAHYDALTNLPNRLLLRTRLEQAVAKSRHENEFGAVLFLDLDGFKHVNDSLGHRAGDELLRLVAQRLRRRLRASDTLARLGGDEFVVLLENLASPQNAALIAQELIDRMAAPFELPGQNEVYISTSVGISIFPLDSTDANELIQHADAALYKAKDAGRGTYRQYAPSLTIAASARVQIDARMRRALDRQEFLLHYQPLVSLSDGSIKGCEALMRWMDPVRGLVPPGEFIPIAEESGFIVQLGEWVMRTACDQLRQWRKEGVHVPRMAVNISPRQFQMPDLLDTLRSILAETQVDPASLELEITEGALMDCGPDATLKLAALKGIGVKLSIDDFGTGYSSLAYLKSFPLDKLKIDRSFIQNIPGDTSANEIATTIVNLARCLDLEVLAEGIETEAQLAFLKDRGCSTGQGYLFSRPLPGTEFVRYFRKHDYVADRLN